MFNTSTGAHGGVADGMGSPDLKSMLIVPLARAGGLMGLFETRSAQCKAGFVEVGSYFFKNLILVRGGQLRQVQLRLEAAVRHVSSSALC